MDDVGGVVYFGLGKTSDRYRSGSFSKHLVFEVGEF